MAGVPVLPAYVTRSGAGRLAFLLYPIALGMLVAEPGWAVAALALTWLTGHPWSRALRRRRLGTGGTAPLAVWTAAFVPSLVAALVLRPWLLVLVLCWVSMLLVEAVLDHRGQSDPTTGSVLLVTASTGMVLTVDAAAEPAGWVPPVAGWQSLLLAGVCAATMTSVLLHAAAVRHPPASWWTRADQLVAIGAAMGVCVVAAAGVTRGMAGLVLLVPVFVLLAERTYLPSTRAIAQRFGPAAFRATEIGWLAVVVASAGLALHV